MTLNELINNIGATATKGSLAVNITNVCYDSRKVAPGSLFVAMRGTGADGHEYIEKAIAAGAAAIVCDRPERFDALPMGIAAVLVENSRKALARIAHEWYGRPTEKMRVVGVTGTNGKTTITYLLKDIFEACGEPTGIIGTTGIFFSGQSIEATHTTPESLELASHFSQMLRAGVRTVIIEASSHALHQSRTDCISFDGAIFTNLTHEHLDYHKSMPEYAAAKKILFDMLPATAPAVVFDNSEFSRFLLSDCKSNSQALIGRNTGDDWRISAEELGLAKSTFELSNKGQEFAAETPLLGSFNVDNAAAAIALAVEMGCPAEKAIEAIRHAKGAPGRMQRQQLRSGAIGIVDYSHTPDALEKAINAVREVLKSNSQGRLVCVFGCGGDRDRTKRPIMGDIASRLADLAIVTDDNPRTENSDAIIDEIFAGIAPEYMSKTVRIPNRHEAIRHAASSAASGDIVLVAGKGHENYQIIGHEKHHFDDAEELGAC